MGTANIATNAKHTIKLTNFALHFISLIIMGSENSIRLLNTPFSGMVMANI